MSIQEIDLYRSMLRIRRFEETILEEFNRGVFSGTTHTSIGQEANAVGVIHPLMAEDVIVTNHRCHGHFLAYGGDMRALFAELMGKVTGVCGGRGGSQHIHWRNLYSNGVQGGIVPIATGMALAEKRSASQAVVTVFIGDGTFGEGVIYEGFNMASLWQAPLLIVVENNHIAQTTPTRLTQAGSLMDRFAAFSISALELDTSDVGEILAASSGLVSEIRTTQKPQALILNTVRFGPHSKGDDTRDADELDALKQVRDPLTILKKRLDRVQVSQVEQEVEEEVKQSFTLALDDPAACFDGGMA